MDELEKEVIGAFQSQLENNISDIDSVIQKMRNYHVRKRSGEQAPVPAISEEQMDAIRAKTGTIAQTRELLNELRRREGGFRAFCAVLRNTEQVVLAATLEDELEKVRLQCGEKETKERDQGESATKSEANKESKWETPKEGNESAERVQEVQEEAAESRRQIQLAAAEKRREAATAQGEQADGGDKSPPRLDTRGETRGSPSSEDQGKAVQLDANGQGKETEGQTGQEESRTDKVTGLPTVESDGYLEVTSPTAADYSSSVSRVAP